MAIITPTLTSLNNLFHRIQQNNPMINGYGYTMKDDIDVYSINFPFIWVQPIGGAAVKTVPDSSRITVFTYDFNIYCLDKIKKGDQNFDDILSDCVYNLQTFITSIDQDATIAALGYNTIGNIVIEPLYEVFDQNCNGCYATITMKVPNRFTPCIIPN